MSLDRDKRGVFLKGHVSARSIVKGVRLVRWNCLHCGIASEKTEAQLGYRIKAPVYCSKKCRYAVGVRRGCKTSESTKEKLREQKLGARNPSWRGGVTPLRLQLMNTQEYKHWRKSVYERDDYTCKVCAQRGGRLEADHIVPYMNNREGLLDVNNGQTLCRKCHREKTVRELKLNWSNQYTSSKEQSL